MYVRNPFYASSCLPVNQFDPEERLCNAALVKQFQMNMTPKAVNMEYEELRIPINPTSSVAFNKPMDQHKNLFPNLPDLIHGNFMANSGLILSNSFVQNYTISPQGHRSLSKHQLNPYAKEFIPLSSRTAEYKTFEQEQFGGSISGCAEDKINKTGQSSTKETSVKIQSHNSTLLQNEPVGKIEPQMASELLVQKCESQPSILKCECKPANSKILNNDKEESTSDSEIITVNLSCSKKYVLDKNETEEQSSENEESLHGRFWRSSDDESDDDEDDFSDVSLDNDAYEDLGPWGGALVLDRLLMCAEDSKNVCINTTIIAIVDDEDFIEFCSSPSSSPPLSPSLLFELFEEREPELSPEMLELNERWEAEVTKDVKPTRTSRVTFNDTVVTREIELVCLEGPSQVRLAMERRQFERKMEDLLAPILAPEHREKVCRRFKDAEIKAAEK